MADHDHHIALLRKFQKARREDNEHEFMEHVADDAEFITPKGTFKGHDEIRKWFHEKSDLPEWEDEWHHVEGHHFQRKGTAKKLLMTFHLVQDVWIHHGKVTKVHVHQA